MERKKSIKSILNLEKLVFDKIEFIREGLKNDDTEIDFEIQTVISKRQRDEMYRVNLQLLGNKEKEYKLTVALSGFFTFDEAEKLTEQEKEVLINKNAVAILMPYLRSEVSLLTAQPEVECVVLPPFNINKMMED